MEASVKDFHGRRGLIGLCLFGFVICSIVFLLTACQKYDFGEKEAEINSSVSPVIPRGHGFGDQDVPLTVSDMLRQGFVRDKQNCWVMGYAVGSTVANMKNAVFGISNSYDHNLLLSDNPTCTNADSCIAVELNTKKMKQQLSLSSNPDFFRCVIVVRGEYDLYFRRPGIKKVTTGYCLPGFSIADVDFLSYDWVVKEINY